MTTKLTDPFETVHKKDIKNKQGVVVAQVDYVGWSQVADRLDEASPGWSFNVVQLHDDWCLGRLTLADGRIFENVGYAENADAEWKKEALKDAVSDALKRCAALVGVARYLYDKDRPRSLPPNPVTRPAAAPQRPVERPRTAAPAAKTPASAPAPDDVAWDGMETLEDMALKAFPDATIEAIPVEDGKCPDHGKAFKSGTKGWYCATPVEKDGERVTKWCQQKPSRAWAAAQELVTA